MKLRPFGVAAGLACAAFAFQAHAACQLQKVAEIPVKMQGLTPTVAAQINGQDITMSVSSGSFFSDVGAAAPAKYRMTPTAAPFGLRITGVGGREGDAKAVRAKNFTFAGVGFHDVEFLVFGQGENGAIGQNILGPFDTEYDFANGVVRLFLAKDCGDANLAYWSTGQAVSRIPIENEGGKILSKVRASAKIDGHGIKVELSSSEVSYLSRQAAARAGIKPASEGVAAGGVTMGAYGRVLETSIAPFDSFAIGGEEIKNTRLRVADIDMESTDMLLGADFFLSHRILVSNSQHKLYFTYNGGPVFKLDRPGGAGTALAQAGAAAPPASAAGGAEAAPATAAEFARRGAAFAARREYVAAIADFTRAIELEPNDATHYSDRALAHLNARQPVLGMADLDQSLKLKPDNVQALIVRAELYAQAKDNVRAQADFDTARKLHPNDAGLPQAMANIYLRLNDYERAIHIYDDWLAAHPKDPGSAGLLSERCNARATWGQQLDVGLADCDAALKMGLKSSRVMENRGIVLLRLGRLDEAIAQFDAAIRAQPKAAWSLYGRGVAKLRKGAKVEGDADIAAALAIRPNVVQEARRYGLEADGATAAQGKS